MITLDKTKSKDIVKVSIILVLSLFMLALILYFIPAVFENAILQRYDYNTTLADMHISTANNLLMAFITFLYVLLTVALVTQSKEQVAQSKEEVAQSKKEQKIKDIENRLEKFYMPAQSTLKITLEFLKDPIHFTKWSEEVYSYERAEHNQDTTPEESANTYAAEKLKEIEKYRFLAKEKTCRSLIKFLYEEESTENRLEFSNCAQEDIKDYLAKLYELKNK